MKYVYELYIVGLEKTKRKYINPRRFQLLRQS